MGSGLCVLAPGPGDACPDPGTGKHANPFCTIQAATACDIVNAAPGTYDLASETFPIVVDRLPTLLGTRAWGQRARSREE